VAVYLKAICDRITFEPGDAPPVELPVTMSYVTQIRGVRIAFLEVIYLEDYADVATLKQGQAGRLDVRNDDVPDLERTIPLGVITCISICSNVKSYLRKTFVITEFVPPGV
jgi:hypothetical protein